jgi:hypothetical protein
MLAVIDRLPATSASRWLAIFPGEYCFVLSHLTILIYCRLGVKTRIFHLGDYRRATAEGGHVPQDYFYPNASPSSVMLRQKILKKCREDIYAWLNHENGQVAIYDAVNPTASGRISLAREFAKHDVQVRGHLRPTSRRYVLMGLR